ncbi:hypothetical protein D3C75_788890 [compost metagenome]
MVVVGQFAVIEQTIGSHAVGDFLAPPPRPGLLAHQRADVPGHADAAIRVAHEQRAVAVIGDAEVLQRFLQFEGVDALAPRQNVEAAVITETVVAVPAFDEVIAEAALEQVAAVGADDERAAGVWFTAASEILDPSGTSCRLRKVGNDQGRILVGQLIEA